MNDLALSNRSTKTFDAGAVPDFRDLNNDDLLAGLSRLLGTRRRLTGRMLLYLAEVEHRRLHLRAAYSSMFEFCVKRSE